MIRKTFATGHPTAMYHPRKPQQHCSDNHKYWLFDVNSRLHQSWLNGQHILSYPGSPGVHLQSTGLLP